MASELRPLVQQTKAKKREGVYTAGNITLAQIGVGPAVARRRTEQLLTEESFDHVLVSGIAGGLDPTLSVGSVVIPEAVRDLASGQTYESSDLAGVTRKGLIGVSDHLITDEHDLARLLEQGVVAVEMESSGVAAACEARGVPWTTFRVIGDRPDEGLTDQAVMTFLRTDGSVDVAAAARYIATHPRKIKGLYKLGRDSARAATAAARAALAAIPR